MPVVTLDPIINNSGEPGTTIAGDPYVSNLPIVPNIPSPTNYGGNVVLPIEENPSNTINVLVPPIREEISMETINSVTTNTSIEAPIKETVQMETIDQSIAQPIKTSSLPPKPNTSMMGGGGSGSSSSVGNDLKKADKKYWWWIAAAVVGIGLYSYKKSK